MADWKKVKYRDLSGTDYVNPDAEQRREMYGEVPSVWQQTKDTLLALSLPVLVIGSIAGIALTCWVLVRLAGRLFG